MKLPSKVFGIRTDEAYSEYLEQSKTKKEPEKQVQPKIPVTNLEGYIILPGDLRSDKYHDLLVEVSRLKYSPKVEQVATQLGLNLQNNDQGFIGSINHEQALGLNRSLENITLAPRYFNDFLYLIYQGVKDNKEVYDAKGKKVDPSLLKKIWDDITEVRSPWRAEWLNAKFKGESKSGILNKLGILEDQFYITYDKVMDDGGVKQVTEELDEDTLMKSRTPGISLENWLKNPTIQGLPRKNVQDGNLYYWKPTNGSVAGFGAGSDGTLLSCDGDPASSNVALGVRAKKIK